jgi:hypothetical protein
MVALFGGGLGSKCGHLLLGRKQTCSIRNFKCWYFSFHAHTNMSSAPLNVLGGSDSESNEVEGSESNEVEGEPAATEVKGESSSEGDGKSSEVDRESSAEVDGKSSEVDGESSEVDGEPSAEAGETGLGSCCRACFLLDGCSCFEQSS